VEETLTSIAVDRPPPSEEAEQHLLLDAGYDAAAVRTTLEEWGYTAHIQSRRAEQAARQQIPGYRARRWVVERLRHEVA
jgi:putative transposase